MAQIITYPELSTLANDDLLIVSDVSAPNKPTKSLKIDTLGKHIIAANDIVTACNNRGPTIGTIPQWCGLSNPKLDDSGYGIEPMRVEYDSKSNVVTYRVGPIGLLSNTLTFNGAGLTANNLTSRAGRTFSALGDSVIGTSSSDDLTVIASSVFRSPVDFEITAPAGFKGTATFASAATFDTVINDNTGGPGTAGQVLSSTGTGVQWTSDTNTTYDLTGTATGNNYKVVLTGSDATVDDVVFLAGTGITLTDQGNNTVNVQASNNGTVTGTGTPNTLTMWNSAGTGIQDSVVFQSGSGQVGIGSPAFTPQRTLDVKGVIRATNAGQAFRAESTSGSGLATTEFENGSAVFRLRNNTGSDTVKIKSNGNSFINGGSLGIGSNNGSARFTVDQGGSIPAAKITNTNTTGVGLVVRKASGNTGDIQTWEHTNGDIKALVDSDGKFGIGLTNPLFDVDIKGTGLRTTRSTSADGFAIVALNSLSNPTSACGIYYTNNVGSLILNDTTQNQNVKIQALGDSYIKGAGSRVGIGDDLTAARTGSKLFVKNGDIQIDRPDSGTFGGGIILQTPDKQNRYKLTIDNNGALVISQV